MAHTYTIELRFSGDHLEPNEISSRLNLNPSDALGQAEKQLSPRKRRPYWAYNGRGKMGFKTEWEVLEDGLNFLLGNLSSRKTEIIALAHQFDARWWCGHFQTSFGGGPTLSPKLLGELSGYGVPLSIDNYFSDE